MTIELLLIAAEYLESQQTALNNGQSDIIITIIKTTRLSVTKVGVADTRLSYGKQT